MSISWVRVNLEKLSKAASHALRHEPWLYELELDDEGWVPVEELLPALRSEKPEWSALSEASLAEMIAAPDKKRHEPAIEESAPSIAIRCR